MKYVRPSDLSSSIYKHILLRGDDVYVCYTQSQICVKDQCCFRLNEIVLFQVGL